MNVGEALKFIRQKKGYKQREMTTEYIDRSAYSRIENGTRSIRINDLQEILNKLSIQAGEFFSYANLNKDYNQQEFRNTYYYCRSHPEDEQKKKKLLGYYGKALSKEEKSLRDISNYISIKNGFCQLWDEVDAITQEEIQMIYEFLIDKEYYFLYDYIIICNLIFQFNETQADALIMKAIPVEDAELRDFETKQIAHNAVLNLVTGRIYEGKFDEARKYIGLAEEQVKSFNDYSSKMHLYYTANLLEYIVSGKPEYYYKIINYINLLKDLGEELYASELSNEVQTLTHGNPKEEIRNHNFSTSLTYDINADTSGNSTDEKE
ncbi:helix-turn-helix domain-containing protein [uncultured Enterococcus sp.]|uniref:helix-turn-helix domain-containing protein n=1 Tax=uncultured Enterococcus sp. TaxID=167972 RepID=UPI002AA72CF0|nr:helix-turn-helix domain-containing protein [uncultured Enterococcus sp.]